MQSHTAMQTPVTRDALSALKAGDWVHLSGEVLVFRDQVHRLLVEALNAGLELPFSLDGRIVYYCGPTPARGDMPVGSAGPTTSARMDRFTGKLLEHGLAGTIGKGDRSPEIAELNRRYGAVYFAATGGAGALLASCVTSARVIAFPELGTEAARVFTVKDMPLIVALDSHGGSAYSVVNL